MKNLVFTAAIALIGLFSSCDKCKDVDCKNGATCNKGDCECTTFYTGDKCDSEIRSTYNGKYAGTVVYSDGTSDTDTIEIRSIATDASKLEIVDGEGIVLTLTNSTDFGLTAEEIDGLDRFVVTGTGNFSSTAMSLNAVSKYYENGVLQDSDSIRFDGNKL